MSLCILRPVAIWCLWSRRRKENWISFFIFSLFFFYWCLLRENHNGNLLRTGSNGENFYGCIFLLFSWGSVTITKKKCTTTSGRNLLLFEVQDEKFSLMMEEFLKDCLMKVDIYWLLVATVRTLLRLLNSTNKNKLNSRHL